METSKPSHATPQDFVNDHQCQRPRFEPEISAVVVLAGQSYSATVLDESCDGIRLRIGGSVPLTPDQEITLQYRELSMPGFVRWVLEEASGQRRIDVQWGRVRPHNAQPITQSQASREATFARIGTLDLVCALGQDMRSGRVRVRFPYGWEHNADRASIRTLTKAQRQTELESLTRGVTTLLALYHLESRATREAAIHAILEFEYDAWPTQAS